MTKETAEAALHLLRTGQIAGLVLLPERAYDNLRWELLVEHIHQEAREHGHVQIGYQNNPVYGHIIAGIYDGDSLEPYPYGIPCWGKSQIDFIDEAFTFTREQLEA